MDPYLPFEFTPEGMLERVNALVQNQVIDINCTLCSPLYGWALMCIKHSALTICSISVCKATNVVSVRFLDSASYMGRVCCWFYPWSERFFYLFIYLFIYLFVFISVHVVVCTVAFQLGDL